MGPRGLALDAGPRGAGLRVCPGAPTGWQVRSVRHHPSARDPVSRAERESCGLRRAQERVRRGSYGPARRLRRSRGQAGLQLDQRGGSHRPPPARHSLAGSRTSICTATACWSCWTSRASATSRSRCASSTGSGATGLWVTESCRLGSPDRGVHATGRFLPRSRLRTTRVQRPAPTPPRLESELDGRAAPLPVRAGRARLAPPARPAVPLPLRADPLGGRPADSRATSSSAPTSERV